MIKREMIVEELRQFLQDKNEDGIRKIFAENRVVDMAGILSDLTSAEIIQIFKSLDRNTEAQLFTYMDDDKQEELINELTGPQLQNVLSDVASDDLADIMGDLPANLVRKILQSSTPQTRKEINLLLSYPEDSAGSIMTVNYFELKQSDTVDGAIAKLKDHGQAAETINTCYVIDIERKLVGSVELKDLLFERRDALIKDIMDKDTVFVETKDDQEKVASIMRRYDLSIIPVVNDETRLIGIITVDDIMDVMDQEVTEDIHKMNAVAPMDDTYEDATVLSIVKSRLPWLSILMITNTFNEMIIGHFESALAVIPALTGFIPVIMDTAGNGGGQSSTMVIRALATDDVHTKDIWKVMIRELTVGILCSIVLFAISFVRIRYFPSELVNESGPLNVALCVCGSMCISLIIGKVIGGTLPILVDTLHLDPASVASPIITTITDSLSLFIYFQLASAFFHL